MTQGFMQSSGRVKVLKKRLIPYHWYWELFNDFFSVLYFLWGDISFALLFLQNFGFKIKNITLVSHKKLFLSSEPFMNKKWKYWSVL